MQATAVLKTIRMSPQKARLVVDQIRGLPVARALTVLEYNTRRGSHYVRKVLESAIANAEHNQGADIDELKVETVFVDAGPVLKRWRPRAKGRAGKILKRTCHILVTVGDGRREG